MLVYNLPRGDKVFGYGGIGIFFAGLKVVGGLEALSTPPTASPTTRFGKRVIFGRVSGRFGAGRGSPVVPDG